MSGGTMGQVYYTKWHNSLQTKYTLYTQGAHAPLRPRKTPRDKVLAVKQVGLWVPLKRSEVLIFFLLLDFDSPAVFISGWLLSMGITELIQNEMVFQDTSFFLLVIETNKPEHSGLNCSILLRYLLIALTGQSNTSSVSIHKVGQWQNSELLKAWFTQKRVLNFGH